MSDQHTPDNAATLRWLAIQERASELRRQYPDWRRGQALFNALHDMDRPLADSIRGTSADPFYCDDDERIEAFAQAIMRRLIRAGVEGQADD